MPRTVLTRLGIKPRKAQGELSCPFDLVKHNSQRIIYYLETDFKDYLDDLHFRLRKRNFFDFRGKGVWQKNDGTGFYHDKDCKSKDRDKLVKRITARIENFRKIMASDTPVLFVMNLIDNDIDLKRLYNVLNKVRGNKFFKVIIFDFINATSDNDDFYILRLPAPIENYSGDWNKSSFVKSKLGRYFEKCIHEYTKAIIDKDF